MEVFDERLVDDGVDDSPVRGTVELTPVERAAREAEKAQLLKGHVISAGDSSPRARRIQPGREHDYPDQVAAHQPDPPSQAELASERPAPQPVERTRVVGMTHTIEALAAQVREDEERLKESKALLKRALKRLGVK